VDDTIERGLRPAHRPAAARIFEDAFGREQRVTVPDPEKRLRFFERTIDGRHVVSALRDGELVGLVGLSARHPDYRGGVLDVAWDPRQLRDILGWVGAAWAQWSTRLAVHRPTAEELYVDGLAVAPSARGTGIGTRLLGEADVIARELQLGWLRLHVLEDNPHAQRLYERLGFRVTNVQSFGHAQRWTGFGALISMERPVGGRSSDGLDAQSH
jgi:ribosomal protein S18 acetylase RimI-like enzyme